MKITTVTGPGAVQDLSTPEAVRTARAIAAFNKSSTAPTQGQAQEHPVKDANNVSVEELGAIKSQAQPSDKTPDSEAPQSPEAADSEKAKEDPALTRQFEQLARQERALRAKAQQQDQALKAREAALVAREQALTQAPAFDPKNYIERSRLQQDALGTLEAEGLATYDDIAQRAISRQPIDPQLQQTINSLKAQINELKAANETSQKSYPEQQQASYKAAVKQIGMDAAQLVKSDPVAYEAITKTGTVREVVKLIEYTYNKDGVLMTVEEAAQEVENYLVEENYGMATKIDKIKKRIAAANASSQQPEVK